MDVIYYINMYEYKMLLFQEIYLFYIEFERADYDAGFITHRMNALLVSCSNVVTGRSSGRYINRDLSYIRSFLDPH